MAWLQGGDYHELALVGLAGPYSEWLPPFAIVFIVNTVARRGRAGSYERTRLLATAFGVHDGSAFFNLSGVFRQQPLTVWKHHYHLLWGCSGFDHAWIYPAFILSLSLKAKANTICIMKGNFPEMDSVCKLTAASLYICLLTLHRKVTEVTEPSEIRSEAVVIKTQNAKITSVVKVKERTVGCRRPWLHSGLAHQAFNWQTVYFFAAFTMVRIRATWKNSEKKKVLEKIESKVTLLRIKLKRDTVFWHPILIILRI